MVITVLVELLCKKARLIFRKKFDNENLTLVEYTLPATFLTHSRRMGGVRRVVVTGLGLVTPLGVGAPHTWLRLTAGRVATAALTDEGYAQVSLEDLPSFDGLTLNG